MKHFWTRNKLLIAIFIFAAALTSFLYTTLYTFDNSGISDKGTELIAQPSSNAVLFDESIKKSVDLPIQIVKNSSNLETPTSQTGKEGETNTTTAISSPTAVDTTQTTQEQTMVEDAKTLFDVTFEIYHRQYDEHHFQIPGDSTVYDAMLSLEKNRSFSFAGKEYGNLGFFVESIGDLTNRELKDRYWIYYINGKKAQVGISNYIIQPNDIITWKYETDETR